MAEIDEELDEGLDDYTPDIITLQDEEGKEHNFEVIDTADYKDIHYMALIPYMGDEETLDEEAELLLMRVGEEDGEEFLDVVTDEDELNEVSAVFADRLSELYDIDADE